MFASFAAMAMAFFSRFETLKEIYSERVIISLFLGIITLVILPPLRAWEQSKIVFVQQKHILKWLTAQTSAAAYW